MNNFIVPGSILILLSLAQRHDSVVQVPDVRFEVFSVKDPHRTQVRLIGVLLVKVSIC